ncbi:MAG: carboxypeptidase regulatory-like domain-containing protein [Acidobacteria bacterium]|nr:carboxypeptidase regulatory-like domain-containing protein [Acidobacteriota bacterium]
MTDRMRWMFLGGICFLMGTLLFGNSALLEVVTKDSSGNGMPRVQVQLTDLDRGSVRTAVTDPDGRSVFPEVNPGRYQLRASKDGFRPVELMGIEVRTGDRLLYPLVLAAGAPDAPQQLTLPPGQVSVTKSQQDNLIDTRSITDLPLNRRDPLDLVSLAPGVVNLRDYPSASGGRIHSNNFQLNGVDNNDTAVIGDIVSPYADAVSEMYVVYSAPAAEYNPMGSAQVDTAIRRGGRDYHGNVYWFHRNDNLDAATWQQNYYDLSKRESKRNQFGGSFGGPIVRDRLFFFFNTEFLTSREAGTYVAQTPTQAFRNQITNPAIANIFNTYYPLPNAGNPSVFDETGQVPWNGMYAWAEATKSDSRAFSLSIDYLIESRHTLRAFFTSNFMDHPRVGTLPHSTNGAFQFEGQELVLGGTWTWFVSPTLVNMLTTGGNIADYDWDRSFDGIADLAFHGGIVGSYPLATDWGMPDYGDQGRCTNVLHVKDAVTWVRGGHIFKFGIDWRWIQNNDESNFGLHPIYYFSAYFNQSPYGRTGRNIMAGWVDTVSQTVYGDGREFFSGRGDLRHWRAREYDFFIQDDWRIRSNLTLNLGLRYEVRPAPFEAEGRLSNVRTSELVSQGYRLPNNANFFDEANWLNGSWWNLKPIEWIGSGADIYLDSSDQRVFDGHYANFGPRLGFAWDPRGDGKTALRSGYGISFGRPCYNLLNWTNSQLPFSHSAILDAQISGFNGIYPDGVAYYFHGHTPPAINLHPEPKTFSNQTVFNSDMNQPYFQTWTFSIQHELAPGNIVTAAYAGSSGVHLLIRANPNQMPPPSEEVVDELIDNGYVSSGGAYLPWFVSYYSAQNTQWNRLNLVNSDGHSRWDALQLSFDRRFHSGLQLHFNYTWAKGFDNGSDAVYTYNGSNPFTSNWYNRNYDKGFAAFDVRHTFNASFIWELPFGPGRRLDADMDGVLGYILDHIIGGWQANGIVQANTGYPLDYKVPIDTLGTGYTNDRGPCRPDVADTVVKTKGNLVGPTQSNFVWTSSRRNAQYPPGYQGGYYKGFFRAPDYWNVDFSLFKDIPLPWFWGEGSRLQLRCEVFNLLNHTNFDAPSRSFTSSNMGKTFSAAASREIQIGIKFIF